MWHHCHIIVVVSSSWWCCVRVVAPCVGGWTTTSEEERTYKFKLSFGPNSPGSAMAVGIGEREEATSSTVVSGLGTQTSFGHIVNHVEY